MYHEDHEFSKHQKIISICDNKLCFSENHLKSISKSEFDPIKAWEKLKSMSIRKEPIENQNTGCLIWNGQKSKDNYGVISIFGKKYPSHLLSVMIKDVITEIPKDELNRSLITRHLCKNKLCCELMMKIILKIKFVMVLYF